MSVEQEAYRMWTLGFPDVRDHVRVVRREGTGEIELFVMYDNGAQRASITLTLSEAVELRQILEAATA